MASLTGWVLFRIIPEQEKQAKVDFAKGEQMERELIEIETKLPVLPPEH